MRVAAAVVVLVLIAGAVLPAHAQTRGRDRMRFGGGTGDAEQLVTVGADLGATYYQLLRVGENSALAGVPREATITRGAAKTAYALNLEHIDVTTSWTSVAYYRPPGARDPLFLQHVGAARVAGAWRPAARARISLSQGAAYRPRDYLSSFGAQAGSVDLDALSFLRPDALESRREYVSADGTFSAGYDLSRRAAVSIDYGYTRRYQLPADYSALSQRAASDFRYALTRNLALNLGYRVSESSPRAGGVRRLRTEAIDSGVSYSKSLSRTRLTLVSFRTGIGMADDFEGRQHYRLNANAQVSRQIGRSWAAAAGYVREMHADEVFADTVQMDGVNASLSGLLSDRLSCSVNVVGSRGTVGFSARDRGIARAGASAGLQWGVTRHLAAGVTYGYYLRQLEAGVALPEGVSRQAEAQTLQVSLSTSVPVFHRARRPNAAR